MPTVRLSGFRLAGVASAVPAKPSLPSDFAGRFGAEEVEKIAQSTGIRKRHIAPSGMCAADLCVAAAKKAMAEAGWTPDSVDGLVFLTQSPEYFVPFNAAILQHRLGLPPTCAAFDVNQGCAGYVYGLWLAASLINGGGLRRVLLLVGDTSTRVSDEDRSVALLFGDAGTATLLEKADNAGDWFFSLGTDGSGAQNLIIPGGCCRNPSSPETRARHDAEKGNRRSAEELYMNGAEVFAFTLARVPAMVKAVLAASGKTLAEVDAVVLHQANRFILEYLAKFLRVSADKLPLSLGEYGNTSCASIPVTLTHCLRETLSQRPMNLLLGGFGVGYSWGAALATVDAMPMPEMIFVEDTPEARGQA